MSSINTDKRSPKGTCRRFYKPKVFVLLYFATSQPQTSVMLRFNLIDNLAHDDKEEESRLQIET